MNLCVMLLGLLLMRLLGLLLMRLLGLLGLLLMWLLGLLGLLLMGLLGLGLLLGLLGLLLGLLLMWLLGLLLGLLGLLGLLLTLLGMLNSLNITPCSLRCWRILMPVRVDYSIEWLRGMNAGIITQDSREFTTKTEADQWLLDVARSDKYKLTNAVIVDILV
jgi:hypothetical protein